MTKLTQLERLKHYAEIGIGVSMTHEQVVETLVEINEMKLAGRKSVESSMKHFADDAQKYAMDAIRFFVWALVCFGAFIALIVFA